MKLRLFELLKEVLGDEGIAYSEYENTIQFIFRCGGHKWNVAFTEDDESFLVYYARYPWIVENENRVLKTLNELNEKLKAGCFTVSGGYPLFRYGAYIFDEFTAKDSICDLLRSSLAKTESEWLRIYSAVNVSEARNGA